MGRELNQGRGKGSIPFLYLQKTGGVRGMTRDLKIRELGGGGVAGVGKGA